MTTRLVTASIPAIAAPSIISLPTSSPNAFSRSEPMSEPRPFIIANAMRRFVGGGRLTTVDISDVNGPQGAWKSLGLPFPPAGYLSRLGLDRFVTFVNEPALHALTGEPRYDLIFLDGDHSPMAVYREISAALKILNPAA